MCAVRSLVSLASVPGFFRRGCSAFVRASRRVCSGEGDFYFLELFVFFGTVVQWLNEFKLVYRSSTRPQRFLALFTRSG